MIAKDQTFTGMTIHLDGCTFVGCTFKNCTIVYAGAVLYRLDSNKFSDCKFELAPPAANALTFLRDLYAMGLGEMVEQTFDQIRTQDDRPITLN